MNCKQFERVLPDFLAAETTPNAAVECAEHIASCASCRKRVEELRNVESLIRSAALAVPEFRPGRAGHVLSGQGWRGANVIIRYAAAIGLAFTAGFWGRGLSGRMETIQPSQLHRAPSAGVGVETPEFAAGPEMQREYLQIAAAYPNTTTFGKSLLLLAKR